MTSMESESGYIEETFSEMTSNPDNKKYITYAFITISIMVVFNYFSNDVIKGMDSKTAISTLTVINICVIFLVVLGPKFYIKDTVNYQNLVQKGLANSTFNTVLWGIIYTCNLFSYYNDPTRLDKGTSSLFGLYEDKNIMISAITATGGLFFDCVTLYGLLRHDETKMPFIKMITIVLTFFAIGVIFIWVVYFTEREIIDTIYDSEEFTKLIDSKMNSADSFIEVVKVVNDCANCTEYKNGGQKFERSKELLSTLSNGRIFTNLQKLFDANRPMSKMFLSKHNRVALYAIIMFLDVFVNISSMTADFIDIIQEWDTKTWYTYVKVLLILGFGTVPIGLDTMALYGVIDNQKL